MENEKIIHNFTYPEDVDKELIPLLNIINCIPGVRTIFSCCGHKREDFYLVLAYTSLQTRSLIDGVFKMKVFNNQFTAEDFYDSMICGNTITEYCIGYYSTKLGLSCKKSRVKTYKKLEKYLLEFVPINNWRYN